MDTKDLIAVPDTLMKTVMVERGIVVVEDGGATVKPVSPKANPTVKTISVELFDEALAKQNAALPAKLHKLVEDLARQGVWAEQKKSLLLMARVPGVETPLKLGYIDKYGKLWTDNVTSSAPPSAARQYLATLAVLIGGSVTEDPTHPRVVGSNGTAPVVADFVDIHRAAWIGAIEAFIAATASEAGIDQGDGR